MASTPAARAARSAPRQLPLHGQDVVAVGAGGYITVLSQSGIVTATSPTSITVRSEDGFTQT